MGQEIFLDLQHAVERGARGIADVIATVLGLTAGRLETGVEQLDRKADATRFGVAIDLRSALVDRRTIPLSRPNQSH